MSFYFYFLINSVHYKQRLELIVYRQLDSSLLFAEIKCVVMVYLTLTVFLDRLIIGWCDSLDYSRLDLKLSWEINMILNSSQSIF